MLEPCFLQEITRIEAFFHHNFFGVEIEHDPNFAPCLTDEAHGSFDGGLCFSSALMMTLAPLVT